ncbi:hypothetical protein BRADI_1g32565v3 [Brachypodium distachyon]|uniref:Uncharacterized protein n=1 Tax=Brachypodium distachyon TaxID=15368 RepID=A0A0Q3JH20_BRADI|nr:hypothetical protein BRADI_1g32565v3 [Brachypodium distachyon]
MDRSRQGHHPSPFNTAMPPSKGSTAAHARHHAPRPSLFIPLQGISYQWTRWQRSVLTFGLGYNANAIV